MIIYGKNPAENSVINEIDTYSQKYPCEAHVAKKIFKQESNYCHFYTDGMPLVSFDNGYGLGQATHPIPNYEQIWSWKKHIKYIITIILAEKHRYAKKYLDEHGNYTDENLDAEIYVYYNGLFHYQHYYVWDATNKAWVSNNDVSCDPNQSNTGWDVTLDKNKGKTLDDLKAGKGTKPNYTGKCYAEHIKNN